MTDDVGQLSRSTVTLAVSTVPLNNTLFAEDISCGLVSLILFTGVRDQSQAVTPMQLFNCIHVHLHLMCIDRMEGTDHYETQEEDPVESRSPHMQINFRCEQVYTKWNSIHTCASMQAATCLVCYGVALHDTTCYCANTMEGSETRALWWS